MNKTMENNFIKKEKIPFAEEVRERKYFNRRNFIYFFMGVFVSFVGIAIFYGVRIFWMSEESGDLSFFGSCWDKNIGVVRIIGEISSTEDPEYYSVAATDVIQQVEELEDNPTIKGILVDIDSGGGSPESAETIMLALKNNIKPVVAIIRNSGMSGSYMVALGADRIFASKFSSVGSIGITRDFLDISEKDKREGVTFYDFSSGKYKAMVKEHKNMTEEQRNVIMEDIMKFHDVFVDYVAEYRNLPKDKVKTIATGRSYTGSDALKLGLIDAIGGLTEAGNWLEKTTGDKPSYCFAKE